MLCTPTYRRIYLNLILFSSYVLAKKALSFKKRARKMLMKLTPVVNFLNILVAAFALIFFCQKITDLYRKYIKGS